MARAGAVNKAHPSARTHRRIRSLEYAMAALSSRHSDAHLQRSRIIWGCNTTAHRSAFPRQCFPTTVELGYITTRTRDSPVAAARRLPWQPLLVIGPGAGARSRGGWSAVARQWVRRNCSQPHLRRGLSRQHGHTTQDPGSSETYRVRRSMNQRTRNNTDLAPTATCVYRHLHMAPRR